jgi:heme exporter protein A
LKRLSATGLACLRGASEVFREVTFSVASGEALLVTGPNGAGKTSLLRTIAGLLRLSAGTLQLAGGDPEASIGEQAHFLGHLDVLKTSPSVSENLAFWTRYLGGGEPRPALERVGLGRLGDVPAGYLSAGQRRRLSLARLVAIARPIWLLDEPTAGLDAAAKAMLLDLAHRHLASGGMIVAATHGPFGLVDAQEITLGAASDRTGAA